jgi:hypothetical protein
MVKGKRMKYGFTGSRTGPFREQQKTLTAFILGGGDDEAIEEWHHGCCVGSDEFSHRAAKAAMPIVGLIVLHPPAIPKLEMKYTDWDKTNCLWYPRKEYLTRNRAIVDNTDELVATPSGPKRHRGSGTWYTIDYALKQNKKVNLIHPNGEIEVL